MANAELNQPLELVGYHGTRSDIADLVMQGLDTLKKSQNHNDWLGDGVYFWLLAPERAMNWAKQRHDRPAVIKAVIQSHNPLNLLDQANLGELQEAYRHFKLICNKTGRELPSNKNGNRQLDCAVINVLHGLREAQGLTPYDCVLGAFEEGGALYEGSGFKQASHGQIAVCDTG